MRRSAAIPCTSTLPENCCLPTMSRTWNGFSAFTINAGHTKVWHMADINGYERSHPEVTSTEAKRRKVAGYAAALRRKKG